MKIAHFGYFLGEGLRKLGHQVTSLPLCKGADLQASVTALCPDVDIVLLELFGGNFPFVDITRCTYKLVVYCIDSSINEFWLEHITKLVDHVFVDQKSSVVPLAKSGIRASWLPLCVSEASFREDRPLKYDVSFVGRVDAHRIKRANLLRLVAKYFPLHTRNDVSAAQMSDIFAESKISLNENLFPGLTLRILQGLAAGTVLFTEADNPDVQELFEDQKDLIYYKPGTLIPRLREVLADYPDYRHIARAGRELCRTHHTSETRAGELLRHIERDEFANPRRCVAERRFHAASAEFLFNVRFGGYIGNVRKTFQEIIETGGTKELTAKAALMLGDMFTRLRRPQDACALYRLSAENGGGAEPLLRDAIVQCGEKAFAAAVRTLQRAVATLENSSVGQSTEPAMEDMSAEQAAFLPQELRNVAAALHDAEENPPDKVSLLLLAARIFLAMGKASILGFLQPSLDEAPGSALALAFKAWECRNSSEVLDVMITCAKQANVEIELLPTLISAIPSCAERKHLLYTAEQAYKSYDNDLAETILVALRTKSQ